jgi:hypothetical protein
LLSAARRRCRAVDGVGRVRTRRARVAAGMSRSCRSRIGSSRARHGPRPGARSIRRWRWLALSRRVRTRQRERLAVGRASPITRATESVRTSPNMSNRRSQIARPTFSSPLRSGTPRCYTTVGSDTSSYAASSLTEAAPWVSREDRAAVDVGQSVERLIEWTIGRAGRRGRFGQVDREPLLQSRDIHWSGSTASARRDRDRPT